jgi:hypothetical protein
MHAAVLDFAEDLPEFLAEFLAQDYFHVISLARLVGTLLHARSRLANSNLSAQGTPPGGAYIQPAPGIVIQATTDTDVNGNLQQSVAGANSGYAYLGVASFRDAWTTVQAGGTAVGPAGGGTVVTCTPGTAGYWEVTATLGLSGTTIAAADSNNMALYQTSTAKFSPLPLVCATAGITGSVTLPPVILSLSAADTVNVKALGAATGTAVYTAAVVARRVG